MAGDDTPSSKLPEPAKGFSDDDLTNLQASLIVENFMRDHPEALHLSAISIATAALSLAFPCPGSNR
jgi:Rap1a immunity proteins